MNFNFKPKASPEDFGWHERGFIPHLDGEEFMQFVTFRLADSMPQEVLVRWRSEAKTDAAFRKRVEEYLDAGYGECWLKRRDVAEMVRWALLYHDGKKYDLHAWVIMPNHAHVLFATLPKIHLPDVMHSIKSYTAHEANKILNRSGQFWQEESFDRYIRNAKHYTAVVRYIENNPVKAGLCNSPDEWEFSSATGAQASRRWSAGVPPAISA
jgi:REP element-mobilizing transposase RayT